ncbi:MAG: hypothetical protein ACREOV_12190 [Candidatus Dormibacteraceae bacterium]
MRERDRRKSEVKYWRRNTMRYIDQLLNELEMLNLADRSDVPTPISIAVEKLIGDVEATSLAAQPRTSVAETMDVLFEIQDVLMYNQIEDE